jgi:hypothetical protein
MTPASKEGEAVLRLTKRLLAVQRDNAHFRAVQAQCAFATETYTGVLQVVDTQNGIAVVSLVRTLLEAVVSAVILAKHQEKLDDFKNHGKWTTFQMARSISAESRFHSPGVKKFRDDTTPECDTLQAYFKPTGNWHLLKTTDAFAEAELPENFRGRYYIRVSAIAHGHPFPVVQQFDRESKDWKIQAEPEEWKKWAEKEGVMSMLLMLHMIDRLSSVFALGLESEIAPVRQQVWGIAEQQMQTFQSPSSRMPHP